MKVKRAKCQRCQSAEVDELVFAISSGDGTASEHRLPRLCPACYQTTTRELAEQQRADEHRARSERDRLRAERRDARMAHVPARFTHARIELVPAEIREQMGSPLEGGVLLLGPVGTGKSFTAWAYLIPLLDAGTVRVEAWRTTALLNALRPAQDRSEDLVARASTAGLLFLDDLGVPKPSDWVLEQFYEILDARYQAKLPLLATSNLPLKDLQERMSSRITSRLAEMCRVVYVLGDDRRRS